MNRIAHRRLATVVFTVCAGSSAAAAAASPAQVADGTSTTLDSVVVTGTRGANRTQFGTLAPVDVISAEEIRAVGSSDLNTVLAALVPSFVVQRLPLADGQVFVRPATLRGLSPDQTLVLVNGHRFHRSALLGARGAQAPDLAQIPTNAIKRIEVLRDGAAAQYGSDAIAGVINIILDDRVGTELGVDVSRYSEGDGLARTYSLKRGWELGAGSLVAFAEHSASEPTDRGVQRADAIAFQAAHPAIAVADPVQRWGQPEQHSTHLGMNLDLPLSDSVGLYGYALFNDGGGVSDFNWRNPDSNASIYKTTAAFPGFDLRSMYPAGFTPRYGSDYRDAQTLAGLKGAFNERFSWDVSAAYGLSKIAYSLGDSINASLGPTSPTAFHLGSLQQREVNLNADFVYALPLAMLPDPVNIAFGAERRNETYAIAAGDPASYAIGGGARYGLAPNANGAPGFSPQQAGSWEQTSYAAYADVEVPLTARFSVGGALRYEDFSSFGSSLNGKLSARLELTPWLALRGAWSNGFRAPTPGQSYATQITQGLDTVSLQVFNSGRLSPQDPIAIALGAKPLKPEASDSLSLGLAWQAPSGLFGSLDLYRIALSDRFSTSQSFVVPATAPNPLHYTSVNYFTNDFDTTTEGADLVFGYQHALGRGRVGATLAYNYNRTQVDNGSTAVAANPTQRILFEQQLPQHKGSLGLTWEQGPLQGLLRMRYYGAWTDSSGNASGDIFQRFGAISLLDLSATYALSQTLSLRLGADNVLNTYPDKATFQASRGLVYSRNAPYDTDGRNLYAQLRLRF
ncbi:TonB-dependent receptor plug domain-containing protein [Xanthomonas graminis]|uniref:TonB-dependent receptor n=1 Tax=Xanthomonas graminis pv. graminis TaxID=134874 RepID=A0A1M4L7C0_9XANT|nr:TonB-dependent receptor [Xanthomonas translucens]EKU24264.1 putative TonB dependent ferric enterobactin receptor [Xanthomonas translucens pv. graminis ART-Xtg29]OAX63246.1 TonB-dependent receptor [Xanthomonas translucens pv. graminis]UKE54983.1 TonB-dependent receptor [Xanthomonas translucens pv. graminis]WIH09351.1 TonB-dependent receptor [Xanthomonas translucens pv. graminis]WIH12660.1 TonB-dependent receptor [Xanthomonas translucens pv. graminis]